MVSQLKILLTPFYVEFKDRIYLLFLYSQLPLDLFLISG